MTSSLFGEHRFAEQALGEAPIQLSCLQAINRLSPLLRSWIMLRGMWGILIMDLSSRLLAGVPTPVWRDARLARVESLFFGIGAQKAGTTWLHDYLLNHPDVVVPHVGVGGKELHYWDSVRPPYKTKYRDMVAGRQRERRWRNLAIRLVGDRGRRDRERQWALYGEALRSGGASHRAYVELLFYRWRGQRAVGEISPAYALLDRDTLAEMAGLSERTKFIFIMRDPLDRLLSGLRFVLHKSGRPVTSAALTESLRQTLDADRDLIMARSRYQDTIRRVESVVPPERVSYHFFETLFDQQELDRLTGFLKVAPRRGLTDKQIHRGHGKEAVVPVDLLGQARALLHPTYEFIGERFGASVPSAWDRIRSTLVQSAAI